MNLQMPQITNSGQMLFLLIILVVSSGCSTNSSAKKTSASPELAEEVGYLTSAEARKDPDRIICRRYAPTGSRGTEKICMTAKQWQRTTDAAQDQLDRAPKSYNDQ